MTDLDTLRQLKRRVEEASGADPDLDDAIWLGLCSDQRLSDLPPNMRAFTDPEGAIRSACEVAERVLPLNALLFTLLIAIKWPDKEDAFAESVAQLVCSVLLSDLISLAETAEAEE